MKIKLDKHYQDIDGVRLAPGEHEVADSLGRYLVEHGHAEDITPAPQPKAKPAPKKADKGNDA